MTNIHRMARTWFEPEIRMVKRIPKNHMRKVLTGIEGSSTLDMDHMVARTSGYGDSLWYVRKENRGMNRIKLTRQSQLPHCYPRQHSSWLIHPQ